MATESEAVGKQNEAASKRPGPIDHRRERGISTRWAPLLIYLPPHCGKARWDQIRSHFQGTTPTWRSHHRASLARLT